jgi:tetratricopeptide (TPR) repeat protein
MRQLLEQRVRIRPDSPKYNLLGLAELESNPKEAATHFKTALRYDLNYAPAYLNLSQAYQKLNEVESARWCLLRCLKLMPYGPSAQDARQRLAALNGNQEER